MPTFRDMPYRHRGFLYIHKPSVVFKARVNHPDGTIYPTREIVFDDVTVGDWEDIKPGQTIMIGSTEGAYDLGRQRVMEITSTTIYVGWSSLGTHDGEVKLADNAYITVLDERLVWGKTPYIQIADGQSFKDRVIFFDPGIEQPPIANGGIGCAGYVDPDTGVLTVTFPSAASFAVYPLATLEDPEWDVIDGTIVDGDENSEEITAEFPPGFRYVELKVIDSRGNSHTTYIPVFAAEKTGEYAPITKFEVTNHTLAVEGSRISFLVHEDIPTSEYPDCTLVMYWEDEWYGSTKGSIYGQAGREHMKFIGFIHNEPTDVTAGERGTIAQTTLDCLDVAGRLALLPGFSQVINRKSSPTSWLELTGANVDRYLVYLLYWHTTALELTDFYWSGSGDTYQFISFTSDGANFYQQVNGRAEATGTGFRLTSDSQGILRVLPDPMNQETGDRTSTSQADLTEGDLLRYSYTKQRPPRVHWIRSEALVATGAELTLQNIVHSISPGAAPGQGEQSQQLTNRLVVSQAQNNIYTGNRYARENAPESLVDFDIAHGGLQIEPARMTWIRATTSGRHAAQRGLVFTNERFLPQAVNITHNANGSKGLSCTAEREVIGEPAARYIPPTGNLPGYTQPDVYYGEIADIADTGFAQGGIPLTLAIFSRDGHLYRTGDFTSDSPTYTDFDLGIDGSLIGVSENAFSPKRLGTGDAVNAWVITVEGGVAARIYSVEDIFAPTPTVTLLFTSASVPTTLGYISSERITPNFVIATWFDETLGAYAAYSTDGTTFTEVEISPLLSGGAHVPTSIAVAVVGNGLAYAAGYGSVGVGGIFKTLDYGATWTYSHGNTGFTLATCIHLPFHNNPSQNRMYYSKQMGGGIAETIYYDGSTETNTKSPPDGEGYGFVPYLLNNRSMATNPTNSNQVAMVKWRIINGTERGFSISPNAGDNWTEIIPSNVENAGLYTCCDIDGAGNIYLWGGSPRIAVINGFTTSIEDRSGNLPDDFPTADPLAIVGG